MLGSAADTDDAVQETILRVIEHVGSFDAARGSAGPWIFRIATNICIDMLRSRGRRALAMDLGPAAEAGSPLSVPLPEERWIEPMPDSRVIAASDPAAIVVERETVRLAFIAALQYLPPRQRAVLILRDVLRYPAGETAEIVSMSAAGVNSALQRARATLAQHGPVRSDPLDETDEAQRVLLERYVNAFQRHDIEELKAVLHADAQSSMPPFPWWIHGAHVLAEVMTNGSCDGARLVATAINGSPGFGQYRPDADGVLRPFGIVVVELYQGAVSHVVTFLGTPDRFAEFDLPPTLTVPGETLTDEFSLRRT
jgi:RNA polymerase sigma-70 factor (ECF subfamily)